MRSTPPRDAVVIDGCASCVWREGGRGGGRKNTSAGSIIPGAATRRRCDLEGSQPQAPPPHTPAVNTAHHLGQQASTARIHAAWAGAPPTQRARAISSQGRRKRRGLEQRTRRGYGCPTCADRNDAMAPVTACTSSLPRPARQRPRSRPRPRPRPRQRRDHRMEGGERYRVQGGGGIR
jgi:hypothetical protein